MVLDDKNKQVRRLDLVLPYLLVYNDCSAVRAPSIIPRLGEARDPLLELGC